MVKRAVDEFVPKFCFQNRVAIGELMCFRTFNSLGLSVLPLLIYNPVGFEFRVPCISLNTRSIIFDFLNYFLFVINNVYDNFLFDVSVLTT